MTVSKRDIQILIGFIGVAAAALVYFLVFRPKMAATDALNAENATLNERVTQLEAIYDQWDFFEEETERMSNEVDEMVAHFPANVLPEDVVFEAIELENDSMAEVKTIGINDAEVLYNPIGYSVEDMNADLEYEPEFDITWDEDWDSEGISDMLGKIFFNDSDNYADVTTAEPEDSAALEQTEEGLGEEGAPAEEAAAPEAPVLEGDNGSGIYLYKKTAAYEMKTDLDQFLICLEYLNDTYNRDVIEEVSLNFDSSTGVLKGAMLLNKYYMVGTGAVYEAPDFSDVTVGTSNLFSTLKGKKKASEED